MFSPRSVLCLCNLLVFGRNLTHRDCLEDLLLLISIPNVTSDFLVRIYLRSLSNRARQLFAKEIGK